MELGGRPRCAAMLADGRAPARDRRARPGTRLGPRQAPRRRHGRRAAAAAVAPRRRARAARPLDASAVRRRHRRWLHLRPRRRRHEEPWSRWSRRRAAPRRRSAGGRARSGPRPDPRGFAGRPVHVHSRRGGRRHRWRGVGRRASARVAPGGRRHQRVRRRRATVGGRAALSDRRRREGLRRIRITFAARGATARCRGRTTPPFSPRTSSRAWPARSRLG